MNWRQKVALLAVLVESLPQQERFSLFDQFRSDIGDFFESIGDKPTRRWLKEKLPNAQALLKKARILVAAKLPISAMVEKGTEGVDTFTVSFGVKVPVRVAWKFAANDSKAAMKFSWQVEGKGMASLAEAIRNLPTEVRYCLWALLDDLLADYEDHLLATEPALFNRRQEAYERMKKGEFVRLEELSDVGSPVGPRG